MSRQEYILDSAELNTFPVIPATLAMTSCPNCGAKRKREWDDCWRCTDANQLFDEIADRDESLEPPGGHVDYDDISGREWNGGWTHK